MPCPDGKFRRKVNICMKMHHMPVFKLPRGYKLARPRVDEAEGGDDVVSRWFEGFKDKYVSVRDSWGFTGAQLIRMSIHEPEKFQQLYGNMFPEEIRGKMRYVGTGSTRISFISDANVCYKFEYNDYNSQSQSEIRDAKRWGHLKCFPKLFSYSMDGCAMAYEVAEAPTDNDFRYLFGGMDSRWLGEQLELYAKSDPNNRLQLLIEAGVMNSPQEKVLLDLMEF